MSTRAKRASAPPDKRTSPPGGGGGNTAAGEYLLDRLRILLGRLQTTTEILQNWPEARGDSAKVHADTATELIATVRKVVLGVRGVERHVNGTGPSSSGGGGSGEGGGGGGGGMSKEALEAFRTSLEDKCPVPLDLLDLLDAGQPFGLNPQCYARGLMRESMRQLAGLERRKRALDMLANAIEGGMDARAQREEEAEKYKRRGETAAIEPTRRGGDESVNEGSTKRKRDDSEEGEGAKKMQRTTDD